MRFWEMHAMTKSLYNRHAVEICDKWNITRMELELLMFLAGNPGCDTASEIIRVRMFAKSHVSASVKSLAERGFVESYYKDGNKKTVHLRLTPAASLIVYEGGELFERFSAMLFDNFTPDEKQNFELMLNRVANNVRNNQNKF